MFTWETLGGIVFIVALATALAIFGSREDDDD